MTIKIKLALWGGGHWGHRGKSSENAVFLGKRHDNKILKLHILFSINFVVIAQAPRFAGVATLKVSFWTEGSSPIFP